VSSIINRARAAVVVIQLVVRSSHDLFFWYLWYNHKLYFKWSNSVCWKISHILSPWQNYLAATDVQSFSYKNSNKLYTFVLNLSKYVFGTYWKTLIIILKYLIFRCCCIIGSFFQGTSHYQLSIWEGTFVTTFPRRTCS